MQAAPQGMAPHVLVVDDDTRLRALLRQYMASNGYRVTAASSAAQARERMASLTFDLIVLDVNMPGEDGLSLTRALRRQMGAGAEVPILLLTARGEAGDRIAGLEAGADDYMPKPFEPRELLLRAAAVLRRVQRVEDALPLRLGSHVFDTSRGELARDGVPIKLTTAETELLKLLAGNARVVLSRADIVRGIAVAGGTVAERSVDVTITRLRRKIEPDPRNPRYLKTVRGEGYALWPE